jgi:environmental stress-induced protein Ves
MLRGTVLLAHQGFYQKTLHSLEQDTFQGDWLTVCHGKAIDFNLMTQKGYHGEITPVALNRAATYAAPASMAPDAARPCAYAVYVWRGRVTLAVEGELNLLEQGDLACIKITTGRVPDSLRLGNTGRTTANCIVSTIFALT